MTTPNEGYDRHEGMIRLLSKQIGDVICIVGCLNLIIAMTVSTLAYTSYKTDLSIQALGQPVGFPTHLPLIAFVIIMVVVGIRCLYVGQKIRKAL